MNFELPYFELESKEKGKKCFQKFETIVRELLSHL